MPWGKHQGVSMSDVPDSYLLWLYENPAMNWKGRNKILLDYILLNLDSIKQNVKNGKR